MKPYRFDKRGLEARIARNLERIKTAIQRAEYEAASAAGEDLI